MEPERQFLGKNQQWRNWRKLEAQQQQQQPGSGTSAGCGPILFDSPLAPTSVCALVSSHRSQHSGSQFRPAALGGDQQRSGHARPPPIPSHPIPSHPISKSPYRALPAMLIPRPPSPPCSSFFLPLRLLVHSVTGAAAEFGGQITAVRPATATGARNEVPKRAKQGCGQPRGKRVAVLPRVASSAVAPLGGGGRRPEEAKLSSCGAAARSFFLAGRTWQQNTAEIAVCVYLDVCVNGVHRSSGERRVARSAGRRTVRPPPSPPVPPPWTCRRPQPRPGASAVASLWRSLGARCDWRGGNVGPDTPARPAILHAS